VRIGATIMGLMGMIVGASASDRILIFAAASTAGAVNEITAMYGASAQTQVAASFAASSTLARQIENGAPADVFLSANSHWMDHLDRAQLLAPGTRRDLLGNRLVLIAPIGGPAETVLSGDLPIAALLGDGLLALGDPDHVPAGQYARAALSSLGLWGAVARKIAPMLDVRAALAMVARGEVPLGVVYRTDARASPDVRIIAMFPETSHHPIVYPVAVVAGRAGEEALAFHDYLASPAAGAVFAKHGFSVR
jgi:molybdate transport system substrate-binding protein|tara:strand:- start:185 stop:937 length:753 start_codon:yes stop_codon:yes gene_type:complete